MILYTLFRGIEFVLLLLPASWRRAFFIGLADIAYVLDAKHKRVIAQNLDFAYDGTLKQEEVARISRSCYRNLMLSFYQVIENRQLSKEEMAQRVRIENAQVVQHALDANRGIIFIAAHLGNWEMGAAAQSHLVLPSLSVYKAMNNSYFERYLLQSRTHQNMKMVEKHGAVRQLSKALKNRQAISLMVDQNIRKRDGIIVNFFGKTARQSAVSSFLARKYDALIIPVFIDAHDATHYTLKFGEAIEVEKSDDSKRDIAKATQRQADVIEAAIRAHPEHWFWCHRRWKSEHPEIYKEP